MTDRDYDSVDALAAVLRDRALTAAAIARLFRVSRVTVSERFRALRKRLRQRGLVLVKTRVRESAVGPMSDAYRIEPDLGKDLLR